MCKTFENSDTGRKFQVNVTCPLLENVHDIQNFLYSWKCLGNVTCP